MFLVPWQLVTFSTTGEWKQSSRSQATGVADAEATPSALSPWVLKVVFDDL